MSGGSEERVLREVCQETEEEQSECLCTVCGVSLSRQRGETLCQEKVLSDVGATVSTERERRMLVPLWSAQFKRLLHFVTVAQPAQDVMDMWRVWCGRTHT